MKRVLLSLWILSLVVAIPIILILPPVFNKYDCKLANQSIYSTGYGRGEREYFVDLDGDGKYERIETFEQNDGSNIFSLQLFRSNGGMVDQINFPGKFNFRTNKIYFADRDNDGNKEIYAFTFKSDSLYLNWVQLTPEIGEIKSLPICKIHTYRDGLIDYKIHSFSCRDLDDDGKNELIFIVDGGYSITPRQIFKVDAVSGRIVASQNTQSGNWRLGFDDLDGDGRQEIISDGCVSPIRPSIKLPYRTRAPYLKVFDCNLHYFFPPVKFFEGILGFTKTFVIHEKGKTELLCAFLSQSSECVPFRVYKIDMKGNKIDSLDFKGVARNIGKYVFQDKAGNFITQIKPSVFLEFNKKLKVVKVHKLHTTSNLNLICNVDINEDGKKEHLFSEVGGNTLDLFSDGFSWHTTIPLNAKFIENADNYKIGKNRFYISTKKGYQIYSFKRNPYYLMRFPVYAGLYLLSVLLVFLFRKLIESQVKERYELKNRVQELQLRTFRNQLEPHFMLNTLNYIGNMFAHESKKDSQYYFGKFASLIKRGLYYADKTETNLFEELEFVRDYLILQKRRMADLDFSIITDEITNLKNIVIPHSLIYGFAENAIKHGLYLKEGPKKLQIEVKKIRKKVEIIITDNGIGRAKSKEMGTTGTGKGLEIISNMLTSYNKLNKRKISFEIVDLADGTEVRILIDKHKK